ncbi:uncharacterized protein LOC121379550 [Gigantopelta aegis]|uniref:uncharacterized protein LOC121379550 n=1 Tax=Gigantopelta aegis TaxID=1735272 RepID=UPI001B8881F8|nr:uncharacterized protein LOC121379550 [Gigantopelta aegis]
MNGLKITCYIGDVTRAEAEGIVIGEGRSMTKLSMVTKALCANAKIKYNDLRDSVNIEYGTLHLKDGSVYSIHADSRWPQLRFRTILMAVVSKCNKGDEKNWKRQMKDLHTNILYEADKARLRSLAIPLLGSGRAGASIDDAADSLVQSLSRFKPNCLKRVLVVSQVPNNIVQHCKGMFLEEFGDSTMVLQQNRSSGRDVHVQSTGRAGAPVELAIDVLLNSMSTEPRDYFEEVHLAVTDETIYDKVVKECQKLNSKPATESNDAWISSSRVSGFVAGFQQPQQVDVFKPVCPICNAIYGVIIGNQPPGDMTFNRDLVHSLPGHPHCGTICITYQFDGGTQGPKHPNPGSLYTGTKRKAYLPDSPEGNKVLGLLQIAFDRGVTFAIGTTGREDAITWNDIHHKTRCDGGARGFGYPDATYLSRVTEELKCKGITEDDL